MKFVLERRECKALDRAITGMVLVLLVCSRSLLACGAVVMATEGLGSKFQLVVDHVFMEYGCHTDRLSGPYLRKMNGILTSGDGLSGKNRSRSYEFT